MDRRQKGRRAARSQARAALAGPRKRGPLGAARLRFGPRASHVAPLSLGTYKYPPEVFSLSRSRALASFYNLVFRFVFVVVVVVLLLVVVLAIRVKERESVCKCCI